MPREWKHPFDLAILARTMSTCVPRPEPFRGLFPRLSRMAIVIQWSRLHLKDGLFALSSIARRAQHPLGGKLVQAQGCLKH